MGGGAQKGCIMVKKAVLVGVSCFLAFVSVAQNVGIGKPPSPNAKVEIFDTTRGILIPRLTTEQRNTHITSPDVGLLIYNSTCNVFQYWDGTQWVSLTPQSVNLGSGWCNNLSDWKYRIPITITNPTSYDMIDFEVALIINTSALISAGKMNLDGSDIRIVDATCGILPHYIESGLNTTATRIWTRIPSVPAGSSITIYIYYGNPSAVSVEDPNATFHWWDDFSTLGNWTLPVGTQYTWAGGILRINGGTAANSGFAYLNAPLPFNLNDGYFLEARVLYHPVSTGSNYSGVLEANSAQLGGCGSNVCGNAVIHYMRNFNATSVAYWAGNGATTSYNIGYATCWNSSDNVWYVLGMKILSNRIDFYRDYALICSSPTFASWAKNLNWIILGYFCNSCGAVDIQDTEYDWVRVRKAYPDQPTIAYGTEEASPCN